MLLKKRTKGEILRAFDVLKAVADEQKAMLERAARTIELLEQRIDQASVAWGNNNARIAERCVAHVREFAGAEAAGELARRMGMQT